MFAIKAFTKGKTNLHVHLRVDNTTTVAQINKMGGTRSRDLLEITTQLWEYALSNSIIVTAEHLPGVLNTVADRESRIFLDSSNWMLSRSVFHQIEMPYLIKVDLFADRLTAQKDKYVSWKPDPGAMGVDAFSLDWFNLEAYAFPPFCLIGQVLSKIVKDGASLILIAPVWPTQPWYAQILKMITEPPILIPPVRDLLTSPQGTNHPLMQNGQLTLAVWHLSGSVLKQKAFQSNLQHSCSTPDVQGPSWLMQCPGKWNCWCHQQQVDPVCASVGHLANFLTVQQVRGLEYSSLNIYRSALSAYHPEIEGYPVGKHPRIKQLMRVQ